MSGVFMHAFSHGMPQAAEIARHLDVSVAQIRVHRFPDDESLVAVSPPSRTACIYCPLDRPNARIVDLVLAVDALRRNGATRLILVAPYLCYMRQDKAFHAGEAVSQRAIGQLFVRLFDRIVTVDPHLHRVSTMSVAFSGIEAESLSAASSIAAFARTRGISSSAIIVGPDKESAQWVGRIAALLGCKTMVGSKRRVGDRNVAIEFPEEALKGQKIFLVDDIVSSGGTVIEAVAALKRRGADEITVAVTHALFDAETERQIREAGATDLWSTDSVPHPTNAIGLGALLAKTLERETGVQP